jgi:hypothetical protein
MRYLSVIWEDRPPTLKAPHPETKERTIAADPPSSWPTKKQQAKTHEQITPGN